MPLLPGMGFVSSGGGGSLAPSNYDPVYGGIPQLPKYTTDIQTTIGEDPWQQWLQIAPGLAPLMQKNVANMAANAAGVVNPDVLTNMVRQASERGIAIGSPLSPNANAAYLQALGLTTNQLQNLAASQMTSLMGAMPTRREQTTTTKTDLSAQQAVYNAAPNPRLAAENAARMAMAGITAGKNSMGAGPGMTIAPGGGMAPRATLDNTVSPDLSWQNLWNSQYLNRPAEPYYYTPNYGVIPQYYGPAGTGTPYYGGLPDNTVYNPSTNTSDYTYGLGGYDLSYPTSSYGDYWNTPGAEMDWVDMGGF